MEHTPITYVIFDLLYLDGVVMLDLPYEERRERLDQLGLSGPRWQTPPSFRAAGEDVLDASKDQGLEGIVAKRLDSTYEPGLRNRAWLKIKNSAMQEVVIGGWRPGTDDVKARSARCSWVSPDQKGSSTSGTSAPDSPTRCSTTSAAATQLEQSDSPFVGSLPRPVTKDAHWTRPDLVGEVQFGEWTGDGVMRHPSWRGLRPDKVPDEVVRES